MSWLSYLTPTRLDTAQSWLMVLTFVFVILTGLFTLLSNQVSRYRMKSDRQEASKELEKTKKELSSTKQQLIAKSEILEQLAKEAKKKTEAIVAREIPRRFTPDQRELIEGVLKPIADAHVRVTAVAGDTEAMAFAQDMLDVLKQANWQVDEITVTIRTDHPVGLHLRTRGPVREIQSAFALAEVLRYVGMDPILSSDPHMEANITEIFIGHRQIK